MLTMTTNVFNYSPYDSRHILSAVTVVLSMKGISAPTFYMRHFQLYLLFISLALGSCNRNDDPPPVGSLTLHLVHFVDNKSLIWDSLMYTNAANELYSVNTLQYYVSGIRLYRNQQLLFDTDTVLYVDAHKENTLTITNTPAGQYDSVALFVGVDPLYNHHGKLDASSENILMEWPDAMGGGYHFLKFEGHWKSSGGTIGFAMHIGTDACLVAAGAKAALQVKSTENNTYILTMNINEWLMHPHTYSFSADGVYTMGNTALMEKIKANGADIFTIHP
jgi:hypothetical protein